MVSEQRHPNEPQPGICTNDAGTHNDKGRCYGLIDTYSFIEMLDAVALLEQSKAFTTQDSKQLKKWFSKLTD